MAFEEGMVVYCDYGEAPACVHSRLVVGVIDPGSFHYVVVSPDFDIFDDILDASNPDFVSFHPPGPNNGLPVGVAPASIYGFAPMAANEYARLLSRGRAFAAAERLRLGIAPVAMGGGAGAPVQRIWVLAESCGPLNIGASVTLPVGFPSLGDYGLMSFPDGDNGNRVCLIQQIDPENLGSFCEQRVQLARASEALEGDDRCAADDLRTMSVKYTANGERFRSFREAVGEMTQTEMADFPYEPRTCLPYLQAVTTVAESSFAHHLAWLQQAKIPEGARASYEDETLSQILDTAICYDSLAVSNLACFEILVRRKQLIAEAHAYDPSAPSYQGSEYWMGNKFKHGGAIVVPALTEHVARKLQADSQILKERRKLEEAKGKSKGKPPKAAPKQPAAGSGS